MIYYRQRRNSFLLRQYFRSWELFVRSERILYWEKERRARKHHERYVGGIRGRGMCLCGMWV